MNDPLPFYFRIDYTSALKNGRAKQRCRIHVKNIDSLQLLIFEISRGDCRDPDTSELITFDKIIKIEKVNVSEKLEN